MKIDQQREQGVYWNWGEIKEEEEVAQKRDGKDNAKNDLQIVRIIKYLNRLKLAWR